MMAHGVEPLEGIRMQLDVVKQENGRTRITLPLGKVPELALDQIEDAVDKLENTDEVRVTRGDEWIACTRIGDGAAVRCSWDEPVIHNYATVRRARNIMSHEIIRRYGVE